MISLYHPNHPGLRQKPVYRGFPVYGPGGDFYRGLLWGSFIGLIASLKGLIAILSDFRLKWLYFNCFGLILIDFNGIFGIDMGNVFWGLMPGFFFQVFCYWCAVSFEILVKNEIINFESVFLAKHDIFDGK